MIHWLNKSHGNGHDNIFSFFLKTAAEVPAFPLTVLFNYALLFGVFSDSLKIAKVVPIHKGNSKSSVSNYRPISILLTISKVIEELIYIRTISFLTKHSILIPTQYGFRSNHATLHALINAVTNAYNNIQNNCFTAFLLLDLKKAFDTISLDILLNKLKHYGLRGVEKNFFLSSLENRQQLVTINHFKSSKMSINYGVPQGSVLGRLLVLLYIDDLPNCRDGVEDIRLKAKDSPSEDRHYRGKGQECSRPKTQTRVFSKEQKRRSSKFFFRRSQKKKRFQKFLSGDLHKKWCRKNF